MMNLPRHARLIAQSLIASVLIVAAIAGQWKLFKLRSVKVDSLAEGAIAALGGLRSLAAEIVWFRADRLQEEGKYVELSQLASTLAFLEPHESEVWSYAAWNLAYNISIMMPTHADRWRWVDAAIKLLRDEGLRLNPADPDLCRELAWLFQIKIGGNIDDASALYRSKWKEIVDGAINADSFQSLGMDSERMKKLEKRYGISDWTQPIASAIYWADLGLEKATGQTKAFLKEILRQSSVSLHASRANPSPLTFQ